jgi:transposase
MLKDGTFYQDLGATHFDRRRPDAQARRLVKRLADIGFSVNSCPRQPSHERSVSL